MAGLLYGVNPKTIVSIPAKEEIAIQAFTLEGIDKCIDKNGYSACSVYQFTLTNNSKTTSYNSRNGSKNLLLNLVYN